MDIENIRNYCLQKPGVTEGFPFDEVTLVFKVMGKMFALLALDATPKQINLKCDPERAIQLRSEYNAIKPGYHMNKANWNTLVLDGSVSAALVLQLIDHSYDLVRNSLPKKVQEQLKQYEQ
ncbi:MmcQ/YjbR family DNA-binding protein [Sphingobacteriales bacterium UPWRP_1]|nr:MmcQ-like protein [Sphingobacteriales bacterium TSM_CSS]PSJ76638.1 MmcQ/YjbR family DNA-binding protein [Sphingobacteriales bacterium UPWRP_1]